MIVAVVLVVVAVIVVRRRLTAAFDQALASYELLLTDAAEGTP